MNLLNKTDDEKDFSKLTQHYCANYEARAPKSKSIFFLFSLVLGLESQTRFLPSWLSVRFCSWAPSRHVGGQERRNLILPIWWLLLSWLPDSSWYGVEGKKYTKQSSSMPAAAIGSSLQLLFVFSSCHHQGFQDQEASIRSSDAWGPTTWDSSLGFWVISTSQPGRAPSSWVWWQPWAPEMLAGAWKHPPLSSVNANSKGVLL